MQYNNIDICSLSHLEKYRKVTKASGNQQTYVLFCETIQSNFHFNSFKVTHINTYTCWCWYNSLWTAFKLNHINTYTGCCWYRRFWTAFKSISLSLRISGKRLKTGLLSAQTIARFYSKPVEEYFSKVIFEV